MKTHRDNGVDLERERQNRRPAAMAGRIFARLWTIRILRPNRRVEVRQFIPRGPRSSNPEPAA